MLRALVACVVATIVALAACIVPSAMASGEHSVRRADTATSVADEHRAFTFELDELEDDLDDDLDDDELNHFVAGWILPRPVQGEAMTIQARRRASCPSAPLRTSNAPPLASVFRPPIAA